MILDLITHKDCFGCGACQEICSAKAIKLVESNEGFLYPQLEISLCTQCNICDNVCPVIHHSKLKHKIGTLYATYTKNKKELLNSSSGGLFFEIANYILNKKGVVFGAFLDHNLNLYHIGISDKSRLKELQGSKYFQSNTSHVFKQIKNLLRQGTYVYYVGTGCQVASLRLFLRKEYNNLLTSDLICHGTPSRLVFKSFISEYEKSNNRKVVSYKFRDKRAGGWSCSQTLEYTKGKTKKTDWFHKIPTGYMKSFMSASFYRECCYSCPFATKERVSDITLADYWNVNKYHKINTLNGVSAIIINTTQGERTFNEIKNNIVFIKSEISFLEKENPNLTSPSQRPENRNYIYSELIKDPQRIVYKYSNISFLEKMKFILKFLMIKLSLLKIYYRLKR